MWTKFISTLNNLQMHICTQEFKPSNYESEQDMLDEAFAVYLMAFEHARAFVEKNQNDE